MCVSGLLFYLRCPQGFIQHENEDLGSTENTISPEYSVELCWFNPQTLRYFASNLTITFEVDDLDGRLTLHVLNELQFGTWNPDHAPNESLTSKILFSGLDFLLEPELNETYHFIAENPSNTTVNIHFSLLLTGDFLRFDYDFIPLYIAFMFTGAATCLASSWKSSTWFDEFLKKWYCPSYKRLKVGESQNEEAQLRLDSMLLSKRLAKRLVMIFFCIVVAFYAYATLSVATAIGKWAPIRPEYGLVLFDIASRQVTFGVLTLLPFFVGVLLLIVLAGTKFEGLGSLLVSKIGLEKRGSAKRSLMDKYVAKKTESLYSFRSLPFYVLIFCPLLFLVYFQLLTIPIVGVSYFTFVAIMLGLVLGFTVWSGVVEACEEKGIGTYALHSYIKRSIVSFVVTSSLYVATVSILILFSISDWWTSLLKSLVLEPVALLESPYASISFDPRLFGLSGLFCIVLAIGLCGFLPFVLFPFLHRMGPKGVIGIFLVFSLTYLTELLVAWALGETAGTVGQPFGTVVPIIAAIVAWIAQSKYEKTIRKLLT
jgi:hypothetical protein